MRRYLEPWHAIHHQPEPERKDMRCTEKISITKDLISNFVAAKPAIDACNARYEDEDTTQQEEEFFMDDAEWMNKQSPSSPQSGGL